jgi:type III restriction enzyme
MTHKQIELKFDPNQDFQLDAIRAVVDLFQGLPQRETRPIPRENGVIPNLPPDQTLSENWLFENVLAIQERNGIKPISNLAVDEGLVLEGAGAESWRYPIFTTEMETGTGKTYVYLRTIYELSQKYHFNKYVIVVPSIAIYEGVIKNFEILQSHFRALYSNLNVHLLKYDSSHMSMLRGFANSPFGEILVMTVQSFDNASGYFRNRLYKADEQLPGEWLPYEYIQQTRPILILDEPQNMKSDLRRAALRTLHPLFSLNYSATHHDPFNQIYALTPFEAYQRGLVKKIQVDGVFETQDLDPQTLILREIKKSPLRAIVQTLAVRNGQVETVEVELKDGDDLFKKTHHPDHRHGFKVTEISAKRSATFVDFDGHERITDEDTFSASKREIFRVQIERTIQRHMATQMKLRKRGIKVLSLFFIDRVANYIDDDGLIKVLFDEAFDRLKGRYDHFADWQAKDVRGGYFARMKPKRGQDEGEIVDTTGRNKTEREAEKAAFELIMRDKERLLSFEEPVSFVFAHSALKEGWDNPNVFQICTLNQTVSEMKKRQEIGRGLRIPVNQEGERVFDDQVNILTIIANESYDLYARKLQTEYHEAGYEKVPPKPSKAGKATVIRNRRIFEKEAFQDFWRKLCKRSRYRIHIDTDALVRDCIVRFNSLDLKKLKPTIVIETGEFVISRFTVSVLDVFDDGSARVEVKKASTKSPKLDKTAAFLVEEKTKLAKEFNDPRLRGFQVREVLADGENASVVFGNDVKVFKGDSFTFSSQAGQEPARKTVTEVNETWPVFNVIDRAAKATGLTRRTVNRIVQEIDEVHLRTLFINPEGFTNQLINALKEELADHIVAHLEFEVALGREDYPLEAFFPEEKDFPQKELIDGGENCIYDQVQVDSDVERRFVENHLSGNDPNVIAYFKFPPSYKVNMPKILGNYNPDWGILREDENGRVLLQLVRETKGHEELEKLRFSNEGRKVKAAQKHFDRINVDYRMVTDTTPLWWKPADHPFEGSD